MKNEQTILEIKPVEIVRTQIRIEGTTPLIVHNFGEKSRREMLEKQMKITKTKGHDAKNPVEDFMNSLYWLTDKPDTATEEAFETAIASGAKFGFPVTAIKQAAVMAASRNEIDVKTTTLRGTFFLKGIGAGGSEFAEICGSTPKMREDVVRIGGISKTADLRYRAEFDPWYMDLMIEFNKNGPITLEQILNLINLGGFTCGIGEWRPEKDGSFGMYRVAVS